MSCKISGVPRTIKSKTPMGELISFVFESLPTAIMRPRGSENKSVKQKISKDVTVPLSIVTNNEFI